MTVRKQYVLDDDLAKRIEEDAKQQNFESETAYVVTAIEHFLKCKKAEVSQAMHLIVTQYDGSCLKCGHKVERGSFVWYGKGVGLVCLDCWIEKLGDKAVVAKYLKMRELKITIVALTKEADRLAEKVEAFKAVDKLEALYEKIDRIIELERKFLTEKIGTPEEKQVWDELVRMKLEGKEALRDVREFLRQFVERKKWIRRATEQTEATPQ